MYEGQHFEDSRYNDTWYQVQDTRYKIQDTRYKILSIRFKVQDMRYVYLVPIDIQVNDTPEYKIFIEHFLVIIFLVVMYEYDKKKTTGKLRA